MNDPFIANELDAVRSAAIDADGVMLCVVIPVTNVIIYPNIITPVTLSAEASTLAAVNVAHAARHTVIALLQKDEDAQNVAPDELYKIGTEVALGHIMPFPEGQKTVLAQGRNRVEVLEFTQTEPYLMARARIVPEEEVYDDQIEALMDTLLGLFQHAGELSEMLPDDVIDYAMTIESPGWMADFIASTLSLTSDERQHILETFDITERLHEVAVMLNRELNMLELRDEINGQIQQEMNRSQREMYLREQMRVIQTELGEEDVFQQELTDVRQQIMDAQLPKDIHDRALKELSRLMIMP
ncbi:MAG: LON peptidase substrate-binding domain-containing protein, partial [Armatimonadetes bacterium]|nr:LON peptidase substrate-binding domain-containing protein [Anaerolineae bacterium]